MLKFSLRTLMLGTFGAGLWMLVVFSIIAKPSYFWLFESVFCLIASVLYYGGLADTKKIGGVISRWLALCGGMASGWYFIGIVGLWLNSPGNSWTTPTLLYGMPLAVIMSLFCFGAAQESFDKADAILHRKSLHQ